MIKNQLVLVIVKTGNLTINLAGILIFCIMLLLGFIIRASIHRRRARKKLDQIRTGTTYSTLAEAGLNLFGGFAGTH